MSVTVPYETSEDESSVTSRLKEGEHESQDFKQRINDNHKIARAIAAFANKRGGSLFIGVDDRGGVVGCSARAEYFSLVNILEHYCSPVPEVHCLVYDIQGKEVLEAIIEDGTDKPYAAKDKSGKWNIYLRIGDRSEKIGNR